MIEKGNILPSSSPCGSPVILVPKKDKTWCMCIDYRALKKISVTNNYRLPWIDELIDNLKGAKFFMKLDLKLVYHQIPIESTNVCKTTFNTKEGLFEWLVMPFNLTNAHATFMRYMADVLQTFIGKFVISILTTYLFTV